MTDAIKQMCLLSVLCGAAMSLAPAGSTKKIMSVLCSAVLIVTILTPLKGFSFEEYALSLAKYRDNSAAVSSDGDKLNENLNRLVIERECISYIEAKAEQNGIDVTDITISMEWNTQGVWVPYSLSGKCRGDIDKLTGIIEAELGIPKDRQSWGTYGGS